MNLIQKAQWCQVHDKHYPLEWYLQSEKRLNAIFEKNFLRWRELEAAHIKATQQTEQAIKLQRLRDAYFNAYHTQYDDDFKVNRHETHHKAMAIAQQWI